MRQEQWVIAIGIVFIAVGLFGCKGPRKSQGSADSGEQAHQQAVEQLLQVRRTGKPIPALSQKFGKLTVEEAYAIQHRWVDRLVASGVKPVGYKVAFASESAQESQGLNEPAYGRLFESMRVARDATLPASAFHKFHAEVEIAYVIDQRIEEAPETLKGLRKKVGYFPVLQGQTLVSAV